VEVSTEVEISTLALRRLGLIFSTNQLLLLECRKRLAKFRIRGRFTFKNTSEKKKKGILFENHFIIMKYDLLFIHIIRLQKDLTKKQRYIFEAMLMKL